MAVAPKKEKAKVERNVSARWTPILAQSWTPISDIFLNQYAKLDLKPQEAMFIIHLMQYKWDASAPYPAASTLAKKMGISIAAVRNYGRALQKKKVLIRVIRSGVSSRYNLKPLFDALEKLKASESAAPASKTPRQRTVRA